MLVIHAPTPRDERAVTRRARIWGIRFVCSGVKFRASAERGRKKVAGQRTLPVRSPPLPRATCTSPRAEGHAERARPRSSVSGAAHGAGDRSQPPAPGGGGHSTATTTAEGHAPALPRHTTAVSGTPIAPRAMHTAEATSLAATASLNAQQRSFEQRRRPGGNAHSCSKAMGTVASLCLQRSFCSSPANVVQDRCVQVQGNGPRGPHCNASVRGVGEHR